MSSASVFEQYWNQNFGLRAGTDLNGAAYGMTDLDDLGFKPLQILQWVNDPKSSQELTPLWHERLQNTICMIDGLTKTKKMNILIVSKAGAAGERYTAQGPCVSGKGQTFKKANKLPSDAKKLHEKEFDATPDGVTEAIKWVSGLVGR